MHNNLNIGIPQVSAPKITGDKDTSDLTCISGQCITFFLHPILVDTLHNQQLISKSSDACMHR